MKFKNKRFHYSYRIVIWALLIWVVTGLFGCAGLAPKQITTPIPENFPRDSFSHSEFENLLQRFVKNGRVNYDAWFSDKSAVLALESYVSAIAAYSPENAPERFAKSTDRKAYWLYTYNALVIKSVLDHWPLESVTDVKSPLELVKGYGFFYQQQFVVGGKIYNLYDIEHQQVFGDDNDPRAHFILNCASGSCPLIRPELPTGDLLEPFLVKATEEFVLDKRNVFIDHQRNVINLSMIFNWYAEDFINDLRRQGIPTERGVLDYLMFVAPEKLKRDLEPAMNYKVTYEEYDWSINKTP